MLGGYKDRAKQWHWYDGTPWQFENFKDGHPKPEDPFPISTDLTIGRYWGKGIWGENCCEYPIICQSSSGKVILNVDSGLSSVSGAFDHDGKKAVYTPLVGMAQCNTNIFEYSNIRIFSTKY